MASCAAVSAASWAGSLDRRAGAVPAASEESARANRIDVVIYDARYPDAERFASALARDGARTFATAGEIVTLWREELATRPDIERLWIAGLTLHSDFEIARGLGVRVQGLSFHVGSQVADPRKYIEAIGTCRYPS